jgi:sulfotransferase family protein
MALKVVGAGLGRTGSHSLKIGLEMLLGGTCYHMVEVFPRPEHVPLWHGAIKGEEPDWFPMLEDFTAAVDWPAAAMWRQLSDAYPESMVLLSERSSPEAWWKSFSETILAVMQRGPDPEMAEWFAMASDMLTAFTPDYADRAACIAAYEAHNENVRRCVAPDRLIQWTPSDGWGPICAGLGLPEPPAPFPHVNTTDDFRALAHLDQPAEDGAAPRQGS